jgi:hypothetical protein
MKEKYCCLGCDEIKQLICKRNKLYKDCGHYNMPKTNFLRSLLDSKSVIDIRSIIQQRMNDIMLEENIKKMLRKGGKRCQKKTSPEQS